MNGPAGKPVPQRIGKYEIVSVLGQGGMGVVYRGRDSRIGRDIAIKTLTEGFSGDPDLLKRFYLEAGHTGNLRHPNIVTVYDFGDEDGLPYIVMEYLDGEPLDKLIRDKAPLHLSVKIEIIVQVCAALAYAHTQGMIHRDVKPANVIVQRDGLVKLLDFGIARTGRGHLDTTLTRTGTLVGTPAYMSPERLKGESFDGRSDIFATGVMLYQFLTGALPFDAEYPAILHQILQQDPAPLGNYLSSYPPLLDQVIARALAKNPQERYSRADDMAADLNAVGAQLKTDRVAELMGVARKAVDGQDYAQAKQRLSEILRIDSQNARAKKLMVGVDRYFTQQRVRERVEQLRQHAEEAMAARNWDQAISDCEEGLQLDAGNSELTPLLARANAGKLTKAQIQQFLREADAARHAGNLESAKDLAGKALDLDPTDSRILAICRVLEQEAEEERKRTRMRQLLQSAQEHLSARRLAEASQALVEAENVASSDVELLRLRDELAEAIRREEQKRLVNALEERVETALTLEQVQAAMHEVIAALEKYPTEPTLLRLRMQLDPRLKEHENKRYIAEVSEACKHLAPTEALARIREGLSRLPGNAALLKLESAMQRRLTRQQQDQMLAEYLAKARALLEDHLYLETVKVLELAEKDGFSSPEMSALLNMARSAAAERVSQDLVERSFLEAKRLLEEQDFEAVIRLLPPVLQRVDEPGLRRQLEEAQQKQHGLEERLEQVIVNVNRLCEMELFDAAIGLIRAEAAGLQQTARVQRALEACSTMLENEAARLEAVGAVYSALCEPECPLDFQRLRQVDAATPPPAGSADVEQRLAARVQVIADQQVTQSIEAARQALGADDPAQAESLLQNVSAWQANSTPAVQAEWTAAQSEIAAAKKVLRFRKVLRR